MDARLKSRVPDGRASKARPRLDEVLPPGFPADAAFGGYKSWGVGRENHKMMLDPYSQTTCLLVSYDENPMGLF